MTWVAGRMSFQMPTSDTGFRPGWRHPECAAVDTSGLNHVEPTQMAVIPN